MCCIFQWICCGTTDLSVQDDHIEDLQSADARCAKIRCSLWVDYPQGHPAAVKDCQPIRDVLDQAIIQGAIEVQDIEAYHRLFVCMCRLNQTPRKSCNGLDGERLKERLERFDGFYEARICGSLRICRIPPESLHIKIQGSDENRWNQA